MSTRGEELTKAQELDKALGMCALGYSSARIGEELGLSRKYVDDMLHAAATDLRKRNQEHVDLAFLQQDRAIQFLYGECIKTILSSPVFPEKAILCALKLLERRARLLGLDKTAPVTRMGGGFSWLDQASPRELEDLARNAGIPIPVPFAGP